MTQEELDALMNEDFDLDETAETDEIHEETNENLNTIDNPNDYRPSAMESWPPPPPTDDNKMVHQLDNVTKESEEKASEIFDLIEIISNDLGGGEKKIKSVITIVDTNIALFTTLCSKFPHVEAFGEQLLQNKAAKESLDSMTDILQNSEDSIMNIMDIMQYQDIHRQKIERVINVMRALSTYMNHLFSGKIDDAKRVGSAVHLPGDTATDDVLSSDDIEALLASFGNK